jgi:hypothetical protein
MRKLVILGVLFAVVAVVPPLAEARSTVTATGVEAGQLWEQRWDRRGQRRYRRPVSWVRTRTVYRGYRVYRVTTRYTRLPNGRVKAKVIRRVRIR